MLDWAYGRQISMNKSGKYTPTQRSFLGGVLVSLRPFVCMIWRIIYRHKWRRQERSSKYAVQLASWQRSNSPKTSVCLSVCPSVRPSVHATSRIHSVAPAVLVGSISYLSHPSLGWLYVFNSFPPCPRPPPQKLFPLTSKPFELNLWYLAQRIYGSGEMYWMTFPWPWLKGCGID